MNRSRLVVVDTNVLVSRLLAPRSKPAQALRKAMTEGKVLVSDATMLELADVLNRSRFDRWVPKATRVAFLRQLTENVSFVPIVEVIRAIRDPRNDHVLEVAVNGRADLILTGDEDLLALDPFRAIPILTPARYLVS
ncbi:MAG: putative toxin-antitoxin system toxin component, PIN family [Alphaproteobacteria bacterium]|nr:putative toxin-antitoxin system toxin component, PIN family [Alphaproteobacteria bacterium]